MRKYNYFPDFYQSFTYFLDFCGIVILKDYITDFKDEVL